MFDLAWSEILIIAVVALVVIGPKDLPRVLYKFGQWIRQARSMASQLQAQIDMMGREAELADLRRQLEETNRKLEETAAAINTLPEDASILGPTEPPPTIEDQPGVGSPPQPEADLSQKAPPKEPLSHD